MRACVRRVLGYARAHLRQLTEIPMSNIVCGALTFALLAGAGVVRASNLVANGDFDTDISGWIEAPDAPVFALDTLDGLPGAPALHLAGNQTTDPAATAASSCIPVDTTTHFDLRAFSRIDAGAVAIGLFVYSGTDCSPAGEITLIPTTAVNADQRWHDIELNDFALPDGARGVRVGLAVGTGTDPNMRTLVATDTLADLAIDVWLPGEAAAWTISTQLNANIPRTIGIAPPADAQP